MSRKTEKSNGTSSNTLNDSMPTFLTFSPRGLYRMSRDIWKPLQEWIQHSKIIIIKKKKHMLYLILFIIYNDSCILPTCNRLFPQQMLEMAMLNDLLPLFLLLFRHFQLSLGFGGKVSQFSDGAYGFHLSNGLL